MTAATSNLYFVTDQLEESTFSEQALTARELEIAHLVSLAMTNREIARTLFISVMTVESHIKSIIGKLGIKNRTAICRWYLVKFEPVAVKREGSFSST